MMNPSLFDDGCERQIRDLHREIDTLREENRWLQHENQRLLSDPRMNTVGKYTVGRTGSRESKAAAYAEIPRTGTKRSHVLDLIAARFPGGRSDEQIQNLTGWDIRCVNARRKELEEGGWVMKADYKIRALSGMEVCVWTLSPTGADRLGLR